MNDAPPVPLEPNPLASASAFPWKLRATQLATLACGAALALLAMCARPALPGGLWLGVFGVAVAAAAALGLSERTDLRASARVVAGRQLLWPLVHSLLALVALWGALRLGVLGVLRQQVLVLGLLVPAAFLWLTAA